MSFKIFKTESEKGPITDRILHALPKWFGIEQSIQDYIKDVEPMEFWVVESEGVIVGFCAVNLHFPHAAEIHVMGILEQFHRSGIGRVLISDIEKELKIKQVVYLQVKTLSPSRENEDYKKTRLFYKSCGFVELEEFPTLWGEANPALMLVKKL